MLDKLLLSEVPDSALLNLLLDVLDLFPGYGALRHLDRFNISRLRFHHGFHDSARLLDHSCYRLVHFCLRSDDFGHFLHLLTHDDLLLFDRFQFVFDLVFGFLHFFKLKPLHYALDRPQHLLLADDFLHFPSGFGHLSILLVSMYMTVLMSVHLIGQIRCILVAPFGACSGAAACLSGDFGPESAL